MFYLLTNYGDVNHARCARVAPIPLTSAAHAATAGAAGTPCHPANAAISTRDNGILLGTPLLYRFPRCPVNDRSMTAIVTLRCDKTQISITRFVSGCLPENDVPVSNGNPGPGGIFINGPHDRSRTCKYLSNIVRGTLVAYTSSVHRVIGTSNVSLSRLYRDCMGRSAPIVM